MKIPRKYLFLKKAAPYLGVVAIILYFVTTCVDERRSNQLEKNIAEIRQLLSRQFNTTGAHDESASIDRVYPFLRYAYQLENYDGSTEKAGNENRVILESSPPVRLRYSKTRAFWFDFGVANLNDKAPIYNVMFSVTFLDDGLTVTPEGHWGTALANQKFLFHFQSVNARAGLNGDGGLSVIFPRPGRYTIQLVINVKGLGDTTRNLPVIVY